MKNYYYKQPRYFSKFKCIGGDCTETCCKDWTIIWSNEEVEKLRQLPCSEKLKIKIDNLFVKFDEKRYTIALESDTNNCPFLNEDGLCSIQKEFGEEYLSFVCKNYPRIIRQTNNVFTRTCSSTCHAALDLICENEDSMDMVLREVNESNVKSGVYTEIELIKHPELKYMNEIFDFLYDILSDKNRDIETSIILGALAAKKLTDYIKNGKVDTLPHIINALKPQIDNKMQIKAIEDIKPNYIFSIGIVNDLLVKLYNRDILRVMYTDGKPDVDKYLLGKEKFNNVTADKNYVVKNVILNYFFEFFSFYYKYDYSLYENYLFFSFCAAAVKLSSAVVGYVCNGEEINKEFICYSAMFARKLDSNKKTISKVIDYFDEHNWNTPAYIASMIK